jgi:23S rRNA (cytosine1962-C5)-methyltransferase
MVHTMPLVTIRPGHVQPVHFGHPWVFQQAVLSVEGGALPGDDVRVVDPQGNLLGHGLYSPRSAIAVRLYTREDRPVDAALLRARIERAAARRRDLGLPGPATSAYRLVHGEGDELPGLIVDVLGDVVAVQLNTVGIKRREGVVFDELERLLRPRAILDRTSPGVGKLEGFEPGSGIARGDDKLDALRFEERGVAYEIPLEVGQKTGFYVDQRELRARVGELAAGKRVLDAYAFVGSFGLAAARGGAAHVISVDESAIAMETAAILARSNGLADRIEQRRQDALGAMEDVSREGGVDLVVCDPPKLAPSRAARRDALGAYRKVARSACRATKPGGLLVFCSCSGAVGHDDLVRALAMGARDVRMNAFVLERHVQAPDHPVPAAFPEGLYLKSVIARIEALG